MQSDVITIKVSFILQFFCIEGTFSSWTGEQSYFKNTLAMVLSLLFFSFFFPWGSGKKRICHWWSKKSSICLFLFCLWSPLLCLDRTSNLVIHRERFHLHFVSYYDAYPISFPISSFLYFKSNIIWYYGSHSLNLKSTPCETQNVSRSCDSAHEIVSSAPWPKLASHSRKPLHMKNSFLKPT